MSDSDDVDVMDARTTAANAEQAAEDENLELQIRKKIQERVGKKLAYLLRYGACKEGLAVHEGGFVKLNDLLDTSLLKQNHIYFNGKSEAANENNNAADAPGRLIIRKVDDLNIIMDELKTSTSHRKVNRFEFKQINNETYVRATYGRKFERSPFHNGSKVKRLLEICLDYIVKNINNYDFEDFPDEFLINELIHRLKRAKKLNAKIVESLVNNNLEHLDFDGIFLTEKVLKIVCRKCKNLKILSLKDCGYFLNDHFFEMILKNCPLIESLNLSNCKDLTDRSLNNICKYIPNLVHLVICGNSRYTEQAVINVVTKCKYLRQLDMFDNDITEDGMNMIIAIALSRPEQQSLKVIHKTYKDHCLAPDKPWFI